MFNKLYSSDQSFRFGLLHDLNVRQRHFPVRFSLYHIRMTLLQMFVSERRLPEPLRAQRTHKSFILGGGMHVVNMSVHRADFTEALRTVRACVRRVTGVDAKVLGQIPAGDKALGADLTQVGLDAQVA